MRLTITHKTEFAYDAPVAYALQRLRLFPMSGPTQTVHDWSLTIEGAREEVHFEDHFGNDTRLISAEGDPHTITVSTAGAVDTIDTDGVTGAHRGFAPLWLFRHGTTLTEAGEGILAMAEQATGNTDLDRLHWLMGTIRDRVAYEIGTTDAATTAEQALARRTGVCQDHAHVFLAAARHLGFPARYVSGYLRLDGVDEQVATHAWAEVHVNALGWVAFDCSNGISPDERYVRIATGRDYRDAMPMSGIRLGSAGERLAVRITVEQ